MNTIDYFVKFYNSLDTLELVLFWVGIFIFLIIIFFSVYLYIKNKQLVSVIKEQNDKLENNKINNNKFEKIELEENNKIKKVNQESVDIRNKNRIYSSNKYKNNYSRYQTSPISVSVKNNKKNKSGENISFTEQLSSRMAEELKPQTIELTEFEKKQEEEAIISYQELLSSSKDKQYNITDDEETTDFIQELKSFRNNL